MTETHTSNLTQRITNFLFEYKELDKSFKEYFDIIDLFPPKSFICCSLISSTKNSLHLHIKKKSALDLSNTKLIIALQ